MGKFLDTMTDIKGGEILSLLGINKLNHIWEANISIQNKMPIYIAYVQSVLLYGTIWKQYMGRSQDNTRRAGWFSKQRVQVLVRSNDESKAQESIRVLSDDVNKRQWNMIWQEKAHLHS